MIRDHIRTLRGTRGKVLRREVFLQFVAPVVLAAAVAWAQVPLQRMADLIAGLAVLAGFLFALVLFVFQLRLSVRDDTGVQQRTSLRTLIDELFSSVLYAVVVAFVLIAASVVGAVLEPQTDEGMPAGLPPIVTAGFTLLAVHLLAVIGMCIRRTRRAYLELRSGG